MKKKIYVLISAVLASILLVGCSADDRPQNGKEAEQNTQVQIEKQADVREDEYPRGQRIAEQTFELNLEPIGEVTFASYLPDNSQNPLADVVLLIEQDGEILSQLPGMSEDNVNIEIFNQVEAVNFSDYNYDGYDDIILIISYYSAAGPDAAMPHFTVRYYTGSETGEFTYEKRMSEDAGNALAEITIKSAKEFIGYKGEQKDDSQNDMGDEAKADMDPLYEAFLKNEISVSNPYVEGMDLTVMDDEKYEAEFEDAQKSYAFVDVNGDENPELIFKISAYPSALMYVLGIYDNELICFDVMETHTKNMAFGVYDYGFVWKSQYEDGFEMVFYTYTAAGQPREARRFAQGDEADISAHEGKEPEWVDWNIVEFDLFSF